MSEVQSEMNELLDDAATGAVDEVDENDIDQENQDGDIDPKDGDKQDDQPKADADDGEVVITIEGVEPEEDEDDKPGDREWLRNLRKEHKALKKRNRELEQKLQSPGVAPVEEQLGPKPTLEACDYDTDDYDRKLEAWYTQKAKVDKRKEEAKAKAEAAQQEWQATVAVYNKAKAEIGIPDIDDLESEVAESLGAEKHALLVAAMDSPVKVIAALGQNKSLLAKFSEMKSLPKMVAALAKLEDKMTIKTKAKTPPPPERRLSGAGKPNVMSQEDRLSELREKAAKTGDATELLAYKRKLAAAKS